MARPGRRQNVPAPYSRKGKTPARYETTPLNKKDEGVNVTERSVENFNKRLGVTSQ